MSNFQTNTNRITGTGIISGGSLELNADPTKFNVLSGSGQIVDNYTNPSNPTLIKIQWTDSIGITDQYLTSSLDTQIAINSSGSIVQLNRLLTTNEYRDYIFLGKTVHSNLTSINSIVKTPVLACGISSKLDDFIRSVGVVNIEGNFVKSNGANLSLDISSGSVFRASSNYFSDSKNPNIINTSGSSPMSFRYRYRNGTGGFITSNIVTTLSPGSYDDGTGVLASVGNSEWTIQRVYTFTIGTAYVTYGQQKYSSILSALDSIHSEEPILDPQFVDASFRAYVVMRGNLTDLTDTTISRIIKAPKIF